MKMSKVVAIAALTVSTTVLSQDIASFQPQRQISGCPSPLATVAGPAQPLVGNDYVELERTGCFGSCPAYKVRIYADGRIHWQGDRDVFTMGVATASIAPAKAQELLEKYRANNFWSLCDRYSAMVTDGPTFYTTVRIGEPAKRVSNYSNVAPAWLEKLEKEVDVLGNTYEWIKGNWKAQLFAYVQDPNASTSPSRVALVQISEAARDTRPGTTPLMIAAGSGQVQEVERLLAEKSDPNATDLSGWTPLMYAAGGRAAAELVPKILAAGANPKTKTAMGQTALMAATWPTSTASSTEVKSLIEAGADPNAQDNNGQTAITFALSRLLANSGPRIEARLAMITAMRSAGARADLRDIYGLTAIDRLDAQAQRQSTPDGAARYTAIRKILTDPVPLP
jgi:hypothetical protein